MFLSTVEVALVPHWKIRIRVHRIIRSRIILLYGLEVSRTGLHLANKNNTASVVFFLLHTYRYIIQLFRDIDLSICFSDVFYLWFSTIRILSHVLDYIFFTKQHARTEYPQWNICVLSTKYMGIHMGKILELCKIKSAKMEKLNLKNYL